jgi:hypothetical protein
MVDLPAQAAQPHTLSTTIAGAPIDVPEPREGVGQWIPGGFPDTPQGALGQLKSLDETVLTAADPVVYEHAYRDLSQPGAPRPEATSWIALLTRMRARAQLPATGMVDGLTAMLDITHGLIKGTASNGRYVVVCVLGQFSVDYKGQTVSAGVGDCQALRWSGSNWQIASGPLAAFAPCAWPGTAEAVGAGYRELR